MPFSALKRLGTSLLSRPTTPSASTPSTPPISSTPPPPAAVTEQTLFPVVTKEEDGEDCDHDCDACPGYGRAFEKIGVDTDDKMFGNVKGYATHVIVATGETDWIRDVEDIKGSFMKAVAKKIDMVENGRLMLSASNLPPPQEYYTAKDENKPQPTTLVLLPSFTVLENVTPADAEEVITKFINPGPTTYTSLTPTDPATATATAVSDRLSTLTLTPPTLTSPTLASHPYPHDFLILLCSHRHRDARCGISAPILRKEFEKHLRPLGLWRDLSDSRPGGASIVFINHVGGHKYAANVIIYRKQGGQGIWLARVAPKHVEGIVKHTIVKGKVVHPDMIRLGFDRSRGVTSW